MRGPVVSNWRGFTLIELITGIVVLAIALTVITSFLFPLAKQSVEPVYQVRAAALSESILNDILVRRFDENNSRSGNSLCGDSGVACTSEVDFGAEAAECSNPNNCGSSSFDDVDDYDSWTLDCEQRLMGSDDDWSYHVCERYPNYGVSITVAYDDSPLSPRSAAYPLSKRVKVDITVPSGQILSFSGYRGNF